MLHLFVLKTCPYCGKVADFIKENSIDINIKDIEQGENFNDLMKLGGKEQVPFLYDDIKEVAMYDSAEIIKYLEKNY